MKTIRAACWRLLGLFRKKRRDEELAAEIQHHLDALTERKIAAGMSPTEARNTALREFGGVEQSRSWRGNSASGCGRTSSARIFASASGCCGAARHFPHSPLFA